MTLEDKAEVDVLLQHRDLALEVCAQHRFVDLLEQVFNTGHQRLPSSASQILRSRRDAEASGRLAVDRTRPGRRRRDLLNLKVLRRGRCVSRPAFATASAIQSGSPACVARTDALAQAF